MRVALAGATHIHVADLARVITGRRDLDVVVWDGEPAQARAVADSLGAVVVSDLEAALTPTDGLDDALDRNVAPPADGHWLDGFLAYGRPSAHRRIVETAATQRLPVFVEKPLAVSPEDVAAMANLEPMPEPFSIGFFLRYAAAFVGLRQAVVNGAVGPVEHVAVRFVHDGLTRGWFDGEHAWMRDPAEGGGGFFDLAVHAVDLVRWVLGPTDAGDVEVESAKLTGTGHHGTATLRTPTGVAVELEAGWEASELMIEMRVAGRSGTLHAHGGQLRHDDTVLLTGPAPNAADAPAAWLAALAGQPHAPLVPFTDAVTNSRDVLALRRTATRG